MGGQLQGKTALVTGASRGIGRAIAVRLGAAGARVAVHCGSGREAAAETLAQVQAAGGSGFLLQTNLLDFAAIPRLLADFDAQAQGPLDILVNNAGIGMEGNIGTTTEAQYDTLFDLNVKAPFFLTQAALPRMPDGGAIVNVSSMVSVVAYPDCIAYSASKSALNSLTRSLAAGLGARRIRVNAVAPGATNTDFIGHLMQIPEAVAAIEGATAMRRVGESEDIAGVVEFLVSPAGAWITGQVIQASGGMHL